MADFNFDRPLDVILPELLARLQKAEQGTVTPTPTPAPVFTTQPSITGSPIVGQTLTASDGVISNGTVSARQWLRNGTAIGGATGATYLLAAADAATSVSVRISATGAGGSVDATSNGVTVTAATVKITISGTPPTTGQVGQAYSFTPTTANGSGTKSFTLSSGTLLGGLSFNTGTGAITGTPTVAGTMNGLVVTVNDSTGSASTTATNVTIAAAVAQLPSGLIQRLMPWDVPAQADNSDITTLTDPIGGHTYTTQSATKPKYRTGGLGGKPFFQVANGQYMTASYTDGPGAAVYAALTSGEYTVITFAADVGGAGGSSNGVYFGNFVNGGGIFGLRAGSGGLLGAYSTLQNGPGNYPGPTTGIAMSAVSCMNSYPFNTTGTTKLLRVYANGSCIGSSTQTGGANAADFGLFCLNNGNNGWAFAGKGYGHLIFNRGLSPAEIKQVQKWFYDQIGMAYPWASASAMYSEFSNSIGNGQNATDTQYSPIAIAAAANNIPLGTWDNLSVSGQNTQGLVRNATDLSDIAAVTGKTLKSVVGEYYNSHWNTGTSVADHLTATGQLVSKIKAAAPSARLAVETMPTSGRDVTDGFVAFDAYVSGVLSGYSGWGAVSVARIDQNANIGRAGDPANTTYFQSDKIHLTGTSGTSGYREKAAVIAPVLAAL